MCGVVVAAAAVLLVCAVSAQAQAQEGQCKEPTIVERRLYDDAKYASPFYVIALPKNEHTKKIDNVCYSYFEDDKKGFFHVMSITNIDGSHQYYTYNKADITDRLGLAEANEAFSNSQCKYHDYTLTPICNVSVFILYRCFREGTCQNIDAGITPGFDVRVTLAATPTVSNECRTEIERSLRDTTELQGGDYILLPNRRKPQCVTKYNNLISIGHDRAYGTNKELSNVTEATQRFGGDEVGAAAPTQGGYQPGPTQGAQPPQTQGRPSTTQSWAQGPNSYNHYSPVKGVQPPNQSYRPGQNYQGAAVYTESAAHTPAHANGHWQQGGSPWPGHGAPGDMHYHVWQNPQKTTTHNGKQPNVFYHVHSWEQPPPGCCPCSGR